MFKIYPSKRKQADERTNGKTSPETQMLAFFKSDVFLRAIFRRCQSVLDYLEAQMRNEQKYSQSYPKLAVLKRGSL